MRLLLFLFISCATFNNRGPLTKSNIHEVLKGSCLSGEGRGQINIGSDSFSFDYGSMFEKETWMLSVDVPFRGEEDLRVKKSGSGFLFSGSFFRQISVGYQDLSRKNNLYRKEYLSSFLQFMGNNLFWLRSFKQKKETWFESYFSKRCGATPVENCTFQHNDRKITVSTNSLKVVKKLDKFTLEWVFEDFSPALGGFFETSKLRLSRGQQSVMGVHFSHESCQNAPLSM